MTLRAALVLEHFRFYCRLPCPTHFRVCCGNEWDTNAIQVYTISENALVAGGLILKLMAFRHRYKASRATQNLFFKRAIVEGVRRYERGPLAHREVGFTQLLHAVEFSCEERVGAAVVVRGDSGRSESKILVCESLPPGYPLY